MNFRFIRMYVAYSLHILRININHYKGETMKKVEFIYRNIFGRIMPAVAYKGRRYELDLHSTILSRRHADHILCGPLRYVHVRKVNQFKKEIENGID